MSLPPDRGPAPSLAKPVAGTRAGTGCATLPALDAQIIDSQGVDARVIAVHPGLSPEANGSGNRDVLVVTASGAQLLLPATLLQQESLHCYRAPFAFAALQHQEAQARPPERASGESLHRLQVVQEEAHLEKRLVDTGRGVRIHKTVTQVPQQVTQALRKDAITVDTIACFQRVIDGAIPEVRYEGDTLVIPVLEEILVVRKQLCLKEEIRITRHQHSVSETQTVMLDKQHVEVERFDEQQDEAPHDRHSKP